MIALAEGVPRLSRAASTHLDAARALAALVVLLEHVRVIFFVDYNQIAAGRGLAVKALYYLAGFGHEAVVVFFVLSGLFISRSVLRRLAGESWSWREYLIDRSVRLYIVLIPGLLLGLLWDGSGLSLVAARDLYYKPILHFGDVFVSQNLTLANFAGNLAFVQSILCPPFGSNGSLWSLANEFWYYILFPGLLISWIRWRDKRRPTLVILAYLVFSVFVLWFMGAEKSLGFAIWLLGFLAVIAGQRKSSSVGFFCGAALSFLAALAFARTRMVSFPVSDVPVGISFALLVYALLRGDMRLPVLYPGAASTFAGFSYSLYVLHLPLFFFLRAVITPHARWQPDFVHLLVGAGVMLLALAYAYGISLLTEANTDRVRRYFRQRENPVRAARPAPSVEPVSSTS